MSENLSTSVGSGQTSTGQPIIAENSNPFIDTANQLQNWLDKSVGSSNSLRVYDAGGLHFGVYAGSFRKTDGTTVSYSGSSSNSITANTTVVVWVDTSGVLHSASSYPGSGDFLKLGTVVAGSSSISSITDGRVVLGSTGFAAPAPVTSVAGKTGIVTLANTDISGLGTAATTDSTSYDASGAASTVQTNLNSHTSNTSNPHSVTKAQVGLGNLANSTQLTVSNNLSDVANATISRKNLQLTQLYVHTYATGGSGTKASPWTGWVANTPWAGHSTFYFLDGYFAMETPLSLLTSNVDFSTGVFATSYEAIKLKGSGNTWLVYIGSTTADDVYMIDLSRGTTTQHNADGYPLLDVQVSGLKFDGGAKWGSSFTTTGGAFGGLKMCYQCQCQKADDLLFTGLRGVGLYWDVVWNGEISNIQIYPFKDNPAGVGQVGDACSPATGLRLYRCDAVNISNIEPEGNLAYGIEMLAGFYCHIEAINFWEYNFSPPEDNPFLNAIGLKVGTCPAGYAGVDALGPYIQPSTYNIFDNISCEGVANGLLLDGAQNNVFNSISIAQATGLSGSNPSVIIQGNSIAKSFGNIFNGGYSAGAIVIQDRTIGNCTISNASPAVVTLTSHGLSSGDPVGFVTTGTLPLPIIPQFPFAVDTVLSNNTFSINRNSNHAQIVNTTTAGSGTHTAVHAGDATQTILNNVGQPNAGLVDNSCSIDTCMQQGNLFLCNRMGIAPSKADQRALTFGIASPENIAVGGFTAGDLVTEGPTDSVSPYHWTWYREGTYFSMNRDCTFRMRFFRDSAPSQSTYATQGVCSISFGYHVLPMTNFHPYFLDGGAVRKIATFDASSPCKFRLPRYNGLLSDIAAADGGPNADINGGLLICNNSSSNGTTYNLYATSGTSWTLVTANV